MRYVSDFPGESLTQQRVNWCEYALTELGMSRRETAEMLAEIEGLSIGYAKNLIYMRFQGAQYRRPDRDMRRGNKPGWSERRKQRLKEEAERTVKEPSVKEIVQEEEEVTDEFVY